MKIVADDKIPFLKGIFEPFTQIDYLPGDQISNPALKDADCLITRSITKVNKDLLEGTRIRCIATATIGFDHIDLNYCQRNNIKVYTAKGCNAPAVVQYVMAALIHIISLEKIKFDQITLGVVGVGTIGTKVAEVAKALGINLLLNDPPRAHFEANTDFVSLNEIAARCDVVSVHVPLTFSGIDKTIYLINRHFIESGRPKYIINTSRGGVVEESAIRKVKNSFKGYVCDVWENEPHVDNEVVKSALISTPHIAGYSLQGKQRATQMVVLAVNDFFRINAEVPGFKNELQAIVPKENLKSLEELFQHIFSKVFPLQKESVAFKTKTAKFENIRRNYTLRNENEFWEIDLSNQTYNFGNTLKQSGFRVKQHE